jgi:hypothetical protein
MQRFEPDEVGRYGYRKYVTDEEMLSKLMIRHVKGDITIGFYQISLEDTVKWICFDIDDHEGERGAEAVRIEVSKLLAVLYKYNIPFLLEASGSKNSYHIWILLKPTKTYNAFLFSRELRAEAGIDCEISPKQERLTKNSKYGNLVKVPLGINRKNDVKSQFLDPTTFEPYPEMVPIPGIACLKDVTEPEEIIEKRDTIQNTESEQNKSKRTPARLGSVLRPCMQGVLDAKTPLNGSEGNSMRVAIAAEALNIGLSIEQTIELFKDQPDFNIGITRKKVEDIYSRCYSRYKCETLQDQCGSLVSSYCSNCSDSEMKNE